MYKNIVFSINSAISCNTKKWSLHDNTNWPRHYQSHI